MPQRGFLEDSSIWLQRWSQKKKKENHETDRQPWQQDAKACEPPSGGGEGGGGGLTTRLSAATPDAFNYCHLRATLRNPPRQTAPQWRERRRVREMKGFHPR